MTPIASPSAPPASIDHRRVACPACGATRGDECRDLVSRQIHWEGHAARRTKAEREAQGYAR